MLKSCRSIYVVSYRWMFKNFGQGKLPQFKSLFNASFLLIVLLTATLLSMQLALRWGLLNIDAYTDTAIMLGTLFFIFLNHLIFLNNKWLKTLNAKLALLSRHNLNRMTIMVLINVILICCFLLFTIH